MHIFEMKIAICLYIPTLSLYLIVYKLVARCIVTLLYASSIHDKRVSPSKSPKLRLEKALWKISNTIVSLDVSHVETFCFTNRNNLFPLMKQFVSIKETNKKQIVFQLVRFKYRIKLPIFDNDDV